MDLKENNNDLENLLPSCWRKLKVHGHPSIGASGVIYAIDGFLVRLVDLDWRFYVVDYVLFYLATTDDGIDHVGHAGGFLFGYLIRVLNQKHLF